MDAMEVINAIVDIINSCGVPVGLLIGCMWLMGKMSDNHRNEIAAEREAHKTEIAELRDMFGRTISDMVTAINNNTLVMQSIRDKLNG